VLDEGLLDELAETLGGQALVDQMLAVFRDALPERLAALREAKDPASLRDAAHALRSPAAGFGIARLAARLERVERAARAGRMVDLSAALRAAEQAEAVLASRLAAQAAA
jgi:HPt (histidine-containing phosphotransfer) domain-containing protein